MKLFIGALTGLSAITGLVSFVTQGDLRAAVKAEVKSQVDVVKVDSENATLATQEFGALSAGRKG
jgi:hypothetical protein